MYNCGDIIDIDSECYCGRTLNDLKDTEDDDLVIYDPYDPDEDDEDDEMDSRDCICENCTYWQAHHLGYSHGMICQRTGENKDPDDYCEYFSIMFHSSNYGDESQYSFIDTEQEKQRKLDNWSRRKF